MRTTEGARTKNEPRRKRGFSTMPVKAAMIDVAVAFGLLAAGASVGAVSAAERPLLLAQASPDAAKLFHGVGVVTAIDAKSGLITLNHENISGLMDAMEMEYQTKPAKLAEGLHVGDKVDFTVDSRNLTIIDVKKLPSAK